MAFFDQVGKKLSQAGQDVAQSTKNFAAINKLNSLIAEEQEKIKGCYSDIGRIYFESFAETPEACLVELVSAVKKSLSEIEKYNEQIKEIKGITNCPSCGAEVPYTSAFCNSCGAKMPVRIKEEIVPDGSIKCQKCSNILPEGFKFCTFCGTAVVVQTSEPESEEKDCIQDEKSCPDCGKVLIVDAAFCTECGYRF